MISRNQILGLGLAVGIMLAGGTGLAVADSTPSPAAPAPAAPTAAPTCEVIVVPGKTVVPLPANIKTTVVPGTPVPCQKVVRGAVPVGAPQTGGGGMAAEVSAWG